MIVTVKVPMLSVLLAVNVRVLVLVVLPGLKEAVTPFGRPAEADKPTEPLKPLRSLTVIVLVVLWPRATLSVLGDAERLKSGAEAFTVKLIETV